MFAYEPPLNPPVDYWEEYKKPEFILSKIHEICQDIVKRQEDTNYQEVFDILYLHIEEHLDKFLPEDDYEFNY